MADIVRSVPGPDKGQVSERLHLAALLMSGVLAGSSKHGSLTIDPAEAARQALRYADALIQAAKA